MIRPLIPHVASFQRITSAVARMYRITPESIAGDSRYQNIVEARHVTMYLIRQSTSYTIKAIAMRFGKDHTSVMYGLKKIERELRDNQDLAERVMALRDELGMVDSWEGTGV